MEQVAAVLRANELEVLREENTKLKDQVDELLRQLLCKRATEQPLSMQGQIAMAALATNPKRASFARKSTPSKIYYHILANEGCTLQDLSRYYGYQYKSVFNLTIQLIKDGLVAMQDSDSLRATVKLRAIGGELEHAC